MQYVDTEIDGVIFRRKQLKIDFACEFEKDFLVGLGDGFALGKKWSNGYRVKAVMLKSYANIYDLTLPPTRDNRLATFLSYGIYKYQTHKTLPAPIVSTL